MASRDRKEDRSFHPLHGGIPKEAGVLSLSQLTLTLLARTGYLQQLKEEGTDEALSRVENIDELINVMMEFEQGEEEVSLETFLG